jgi:hypothetical protein
VLLELPDPAAADVLVDPADVLVFDPIFVAELLYISSTPFSHISIIPGLTDLLDLGVCV